MKTFEEMLECEVVRMKSEQISAKNYNTLVYFELRIIYYIFRQHHFKNITFNLLAIEML